MEDKAHWNPVFAHLTRNTRRPSARATLGLAAGLILASLALTVFLMTHVEEYIPFEIHPVTTLTIISWGLHLFMPLFAGPPAAILTAREMQDESFQLLRVTPGYSPGGAVRGLVLAVLYHLRAPLVLMVALSPLMMVEPYLSDRYWANPDHGCYVFVSHEEWAEEEIDLYSADLHHNMCIEPSDKRLLLGSLVILLFPVGLWGATLFSASLAVWLALWWGRKGRVWVYLFVGWPLCIWVWGVFTTLMGSAWGSILFVPLKPLPPGSTMPAHTIEPWPPPGLYVVVLLAVVFYVLAWGVMRLARRWA